jgi:Xaa-Pro aminopeptidase
MRYMPIDSSLFVTNRERFAKQLKQNALAVFHSNDIMPKSADGKHPFVQHPDLFYLTGVDQEDTVLMIYPDVKEIKHKEILFIRKTSDEIAIWEGNKLSQEEARKISGVQTVFWTEDFQKIFRSVVFDAERIYLNTNEHSRADVTVETKDIRFLKWCREVYPLHQYERLAPIMQNLRSIKSKMEIDLIREACGIAEKAFRRVLQVVKPGIWEFEVEAEILHEFVKNRSRWPAFDPIVASGFNSCILHYTENNQQCRKGDLLLIDFGAEYSNYASDVTRTIPVSGKFSERQRQIYEAVHRIQKQAIKMLIPGNTFHIYHKEVGKVVESELIQLGLLTSQDKSKENDENPLYKKYFMHGISHHLGLDVHDLGDKHRMFEEGMVLTCEPGIYVREEKTGVRIENDILITEQGPVDLTWKIPSDPAEIEDLMNS